MDIKQRRFSVLQLILWNCTIGGHLFFSDVYADNTINLSSECYYNEDPTITIDSCTKLIQIEPRNSKAFFYRGIAKYWAERYNEAIVDLNNALYLEPNNTRAYSFRGSAKLRVEDNLGAIEDFSTLISLDPKDLHAYLDRGQAKYNLKDYGGAIRDFNYILIADPKFWRAYLSRGASKFDLKDYRGAVKDYSQAIVLMEYIINKPVTIPTEVSEESKINMQNFITEANELLKEEIAKAYFNQGIAKLIIHEKNEGCLDLSKAGELGFAKAYDLIQKYCN